MLHLIIIREKETIIKSFYMNIEDLGAGRSTERKLDKEETLTTGTPKVVSMKSLCWKLSKVALASLISFTSWV